MLYLLCLRIPNVVLKSATFPIDFQALSPFGVFGMSRVGQDGQQFLIARWPPAILRRAVPLSGDAGGILGVGERRLGLLDQDRMFPVIAEVIGIGEAGDA